MQTPSPRHFLRECLLATAFAVAASAHAVPVTYTEVISGYGSGNGPSPSGVLGNVEFGGHGASTGDAILKFTFQGDTANVVPFAIGARTGYEILAGSATVQVLDGVGTVLAEGTFLQSAGIYVSIDNPGRGVGFGSHGVLPSDPAFPGQPLYPYAMIANNNIDVSTYDLGSDFVIESVNAATCIGFPHVCAPGFALATTAGDLIIDPSFGGQFGTFTARIPEPSTLGLLGLALAAASRKRRSKRTIATAAAASRP